MDRSDLKDARRIVVKVGTSLLTRPDGSLDRALVRALAREIASFVRGGRRVAVVTSGAVGAGLAPLGFAKRPASLPDAQAASAAGQILVIDAWREALARAGLAAAQLLLTRDGLEDRVRYLNARNTLNALFARSAVPVVNENDTVAVEEIRFGDNDLLSALVANAAEADLLILLTDVAGLMTADPRTHKSAKVISLARRVTKEIEAIASRGASHVGVGGGMQSKLAAARICLAAKRPMIISSGRGKNALARLLAGKQIGTFFAPERAAKKIGARRTWIALSRRTAGEIRIDAGAVKALVERKKSLLPSGVTSVRGSFRVGDTVRIAGPDGREVARGLANYAADEVEKIKGLKSGEIARTLGSKPFDEVVHRDNLVVGAEENA